MHYIKVPALYILKFLGQLIDQILTNSEVFININNENKTKMFSEHRIYIENTEQIMCMCVVFKYITV